MQNRINEELSIKNGLVMNNQYDLYKNVENLYKNLFEIYLKSIINLNKYDEELMTSSLDFSVAKPSTKQLVSGLNEYLDLKYFYLLNNFFVKNLSLSDIEILKEELKKEKIIADEKLMDLIKRTYKDVLMDTKEKYKICYGYATLENLIENDALVLKIFYGKNMKQLEDKEFIVNIREKKQFLNSLSVKIEEEVKNKLGISCVVLTEKIPN